MIKIGYGRDIHSLSNNGRDLILGGIKIPSEKKVVAHSDGDVLFHALGEALFGALGMEDLGYYFPDNDEKCANMDSSKIIYFAKEELQKKGYRINNIDISIILQKPKLKPFIQDIKNNIKNILELDLENISVKAQTNEKLDAIGKEEAIEVICALLIEN